jgi:hypothetical protein
VLRWPVFGSNANAGIELPFVIADAPIWRNIILRLLQNADYGIKKPECELL